MGPFTRIWENLRDSALEIVFGRFMNRHRSVVPEGERDPEESNGDPPSHTFVSADFVQGQRISRTARARGFVSCRRPGIQLRPKEEAASCAHPASITIKRRDAAKVPLGLFSDASKVFFGFEHALTRQWNVLRDERPFPSASKLPRHGFC